MTCPLSEGRLHGHGQLSVNVNNSTRISQIRLKPCKGMTRFSVSRIKLMVEIATIHYQLRFNLLAFTLVPAASSTHSISAQLQVK